MSGSNNNMISSLNQARQLVKDIQEQISQIYAVAPSLQETPILEGASGQIQDILIHCYSEFRQAEDKLARPALRIATIGTTSAGKSTLVNGLIGRMIAPMDASELSAGVLHLVHSERRRLQVNASQEGHWHAIDHFYDRNDAESAIEADHEMYHYVREDIFKKYHSAKEQSTVSIPEVCIEGPLLPAAWPKLLQLPDGVGVEIYDLPGLNSIADKTNLSVIQNHLNQCFSLVVMDYAHTDKSSRTALVKEINEVVKALGGNTDTMVFVLNRVDMRSETDDPLKNRLDEFARAIQQELNLPAPPCIIPISAKPLFYAQCAWGWSDPTQEQPTTTLLFQTELLKKFREDCATFITKLEGENDEFENWLDDVKKALRQNKDCSSLPDELMSTENLKQWVNWAWLHTATLDLWQELRTRVGERFAEIVVAPTLIKPLASLETLLAQLAAYSKIQKLENKDAIENQKSHLQQQFEALQTFLEQERQEFEVVIQKTTTQIITAMTTVKEVKKPDGQIVKSLDEKDVDAAIKSLFGLAATDREPESAAALRTIVQDIKKDLSKNLLVPVRNYYRNGLTSDELKDELKVLPQENRKAIADAAERYGRSGMAQEYLDIGYNKKGKRGSPEERSINCAQNDAIALFKAIRKGSAVRSLYLLQSRNVAIQAAMRALLTLGTDQIEQRISKELPNDADTLLAIYRQQLAEVDLEPLPDDMFDLGKIESTKSQEKEKHGTKQVLVVGSCFDSHSEVDNIESVDYIKLSLPNLDAMVSQWEEGIAKGEINLWKAVGDWLAQYTRDQNRLFQQALDQSQKFLLDSLNQRLQQSDDEYQRKLAEIKELDQLCSNLKVNRHKLKATGESQEAGK